MATIVTELEELFQRTFGTKPYVVNNVTPSDVKGEQFKLNVTNAAADGGITSKGSSYQETFLGVEIWLPTRLINQSGSEFYLPYSVIRVSHNVDFIKTSLNKRRGRVKELYSIDDLNINIKGFLIDKEKRFFPQEDLEKMNALRNNPTDWFLQNALTDFFLEADDRVCIESWDLPEVEGGRKHVRPFTMKLCSDSIFTLEAE